MTLAVGSVIVVALLVPETLSQARLSPLAGAAIWLATLALRALLAVILAVTIVSFVPATQLFELVTGWCLDGIAPLFSSHRGLSGHGLGETAVLLPSFILALSALLALVAAMRGVWLVAEWLRSSTVGSGPGGSVIVGGPEVLVAAAGLRAPRIVVSAGALAELDDTELEVSLEHERGHIVRQHRYILVLAGLLHAIARFLPGSRRAFDRLRFHLERDADEFALRRGGDSLALASAICKAAGSAAASPAPVAHLAGADTAARLRLLIRPQRTSGAVGRWSARSLAGLLVGCVLVVGLTVPGMASAGVAQLHKPVAIVQCQ